MQSTPHEMAAELVKLVPTKRQARFYRLAVWPNLFGGFSLASEYGRIGQPGHLRLDTFMRQPLKTITEKHLHMKKVEGEFTVHPPKKPRR